MKKVFVFCFLALALLACDKDKFETVPQVEIKSLSPDVVVNDGFFSLTATIRDKEGDLQDTILLVQKYFVVGAPNHLTVDTSRFSLSDFGFPNTSEIELQANFSYNEIRDRYIYVSGFNTDREYAVGIIAKDKANNRSEYRESSRVLLKKL